ncbi:MAG: hypothetical protein WC846_00160 [Candidatus Gracilibacteria bacterium]|jgi:hypothetical protein
MTSIITTSQLQKQIGKISAQVLSRAFVVTNSGEGRMVLLPYFDGCIDNIDDYLEDYEVLQNKEALSKELLASRASGKSKLKI